MSAFRRFVSAFSLFLVLGAAACNTSLVGTEDCGDADVACMGGGGTITHGSDN
jgi:hypothetical protein